MPEPTTPLIERPWEDVERMLDVDAALEHVLSAFAPLQVNLGATPRRRQHGPGRRRRRSRRCPAVSQLGDGWLRGASGGHGLRDLVGAGCSCRSPPMWPPGSATCRGLAPVRRSAS